MNDKLMQCITNPIMCKLLLEIQARGQATTKQLAEAYPDVPQATLYRYLNRMLKDDILKVVSENKVRGILEKIYALQETLQIDPENLPVGKEGENYLQMFTQFTMRLLREFQKYAEREDIDLQNDGSGFSSCPLYLTNAELEEMVIAMKSILKPLQENKPSEGRKLRTIGFVITPPPNIE